ncbi:unnamed protein product [Paramecium pentaurelia]|uniref:Uncharacterized protein n=1 Tax=Paramecium pentaurelia TaxID=43138 RepID=A0A8S1YCL6_9CILI|nr:unnamed protein product [Paramecium pentaurelia]
MSFIGKVLLFTALAGYSYLIFTDVSIGKQFETKYVEFQKHQLVKQYIPSDTFKLLPAVLAKQVVAGLIASSALMFLCGCLVFLPVLGLLLQVAITANPLINNDQTTQIEFLKIMALIGGLLLWSSSNCSAKKATKVKPE